MKIDSFDRNRKYKYLLSITSMLFTLIFISCRSSQSLEESPRNIVLISLDTLRADHLGCYGYERDTSPNIDNLAKKGVLFKNVVSQSEKTAPSHMTMFTSLYPSVHRVSLGKTVNSMSILPAQFTTLPQILKDQGFKTAAFTGGGQVAAEFGFARGFDIFKENMGRLFDSKLKQVKDWINKNKKSRFFLFLHTYQIHDPYVPPAPFNKKFSNNYEGWIVDNYLTLKIRAREEDYEKMSRKFWGGNKNFTDDGYIRVDNFSEDDVQQLIDLYDGEIAYTDNWIQQVIKELENQNLLENTLIIITSDHGEEFLEHHGFLHEDLYFEDVTVPLIMIWINNFPSGAIIEEQVRLLDLLPTILNITSSPIPEYCQGQSLIPFIKGNREFLPAFSESPFGFRKALRTEEWCYIEDDELGNQLYSRHDDPQEKINLIKHENASVLIALHRLVADNVENNNVLIKAILKNDVSPKKRPSEETIKKLKALGYIH